MSSKPALKITSSMSAASTSIEAMTKALQCAQKLHLLIDENSVAIGTAMLVEVDKPTVIALLREYFPIITQDNSDEIFDQAVSHLTDFTMDCSIWETGHFIWHIAEEASGNETRH